MPAGIGAAHYTAVLSLAGPVTGAFSRPPPERPSPTRLRRATSPWGRGRPQSGMLSCFFQGLLSCFPFKLRNARTMRRRVPWGMITSSM